MVSGQGGNLVFLFRALALVLHTVFFNELINVLLVQASAMP